MKKSITKVCLLGILLMFAGRVKAQQCTELISNGDFGTVTSTSGNSQFCDGYVPSWTASHGSPQAGGGSPHSPLYKAYLWGALSTGEGIKTNVSITNGTKYVLTYWYKRSSISAHDATHVYVKLVPSSFTFPSCGSTSIPNPSVYQTISHLQNVGNTAWQMEQICFTADANYSQLYMYPLTNNQANAAWVEFDDISLVEFTADAGPDQNIGCGGSTVIGPSCFIPGASYSWSPSTGLSNPNIRNPSAGPSTQTTYTLTVTGPNSCSETDQVQVTPPACCLTAGFSWNPFPPCGIQFNNTSSSLNGPIISYHWDFGDGSSSNEINPVHYYEFPGPYEVCLTVVTFTNGQCCVEKFCEIVHSECPNPECIIEPAFTFQPVCGDPCSFEFSGLIPSGSFTNRSIHAWSWDFGDGTTGFGQNVQHSFPSDGMYHVCVTAIGYNSTGCCTGEYCFDLQVTGCSPADEPAQNSTSSELPITNLYYKIYPNPSSQGTTIEYEIAETSQVNIAVYDLQGKLLKSIVTNQSQETGFYSVELPGAFFPSGTYICKFEINNANFTEKIVIIK